MRANIVTYDMVLTVIQEMLTNGDRISVRNVRARTGGASDRITEFVKQWHDENNKNNQNSTNNAISLALQQAIIADRNALATQIKEKHKTEVDSLNSMILEIKGMLNELEEDVTRKNTEIKNLEKQLIATNQSNNMYQEQLKQLEHKLESSIKQQNTAITESAKALLQLERADKLNIELKQQLKTLESNLSEANTAKYSAEKDSAVWQSKYEQLFENTNKQLK